MRRPWAFLIASVALLGSARPTPGQTEVELRASTMEYRFADLSHTFGSGLVLDALYVSLPGLDQVLLGVGYELEANDVVSLTPFLYRASGEEARGAILGGLIYVEGRRWRLLGFVGHYLPTGGDIPDYTFVDSLDVTRAIGRWEFGASADAYKSDGEFFWLLGPTLKRNDTRGAWGLSARFGDATEYRLIRSLAF